MHIRKFLAAVVIATSPAMAQAAEDTIIWSQQGGTQSVSRRELEALLAPIALYPDQLLSEILMAATYPLEVVEAERWAERHRGLQGGALADELDNEDWDPSVKALVAFPEILRMLDSDLDWMKDVGDAFIASEADVMDSVQSLRQEARAAGRLASDLHRRVEITDGYIVIEPASPDVVYVPFYDPRVAYGAWAYPEYPPFYIPPPYGYDFVPGISYNYISISPFWGWSSWDWGQRRISIIDLPRYRQHNNGRWQGGNDNVWRHDPVHRRGVGRGERGRDTANRVPGQDRGRDNGNTQGDSNPQRRARGPVTPGANTTVTTTNQNDNFRLRRRTDPPQLPNVTPSLPDTTPPLRAGTTLPRIAPPVASAPENQPQSDRLNAMRGRRDGNDDNNGDQRNRRQFRDANIGAPPPNADPSAQQQQHQRQFDPGQRGVRGQNFGAAPQAPMAGVPPAIAPEAAQAPQPRAFGRGNDGGPRRIPRGTQPPQPDSAGQQGQGDDGNADGCGPRQRCR